ncbi:MAG: hypothetical protein IJR48_08955 [Oscillibacter sp.]|nr:hypothetical protein [Oscillibacter sp.]
MNAEALRDIRDRIDAVYDLLDVIHEECTSDGRICNAVHGVERLVGGIANDLQAAIDNE